MTRGIEATESLPENRHSGTERTPYRVLMIAPTSFFADYGCHVRILEETRILEKLGCRVTICTYHNGRDLPEVDIRRTINIPWRSDYEVGSSRHKIAFDVLLFLRSLSAMWQTKPQVIHAHLHEGALIGYILSRLWRIPLVFDFQGSLTSEMIDHGFLSPKGPFYAPMYRLETLIDRAATRILTSSSHAIDLLTDKFGCRKEKITLVPDCVNLDAFARSRDQSAVMHLRQKWSIPPHRMVVVYLGLLAEYQGIGALLNAARIISSHREDLHFLIGGYPNVDVYRERAAKLGIADYVTFAGKICYEDAPRLLSVGDIAVCPKLSKTEGAGKLLNYLSMGLPTVAFDTAVSHEYLGEHGLYALRGDSTDLARCLEELADDPQRRIELGASLRRRAEERYSWEVAGRIILDTYASVIR
ncbi:MAG: hypothetical protein A2Y73_03700 [Chloroflexi bacterium RBG_13_56_8]|nr:MAG: hypothetical protein A2Y73_03700 [Chloroflexi bacterium RBG_13_56_8]